MNVLPVASAKPKLLTATDWAAAAQELKVETAVLRAVADVESGGDAFFMSGQPKILFEAHVFSRLTHHLCDVSHPHISSAKWNRALYKGGEREYDRLKEAMTLNPVAACESASWGRFQIMGFHWQLCGYKTVFDFVAAQFTSELEQLDCFMSYISANRLTRHLQTKNWAAFALGYNGPGYKANKYDTKLEAAYNRRKLA